jgi:hypothetical protein
MTDEGRESQHKSDRRAPSAGNLFDPAAPRPASPPARPVGPAPSAATPPIAPPPAATPPTWTPPTWTPPVAPTRPQYAPPAGPPPAAPPPAATDQDDLDGDELETEEPPLTLADRVRRLQPAPVILTIISVGAFVFLAQAMTSHTTPVSVLLSAGVVTCLVFGIDAGVASLSTWSASRDGLTRRALLLSAVGGVAALISAGAFAGVLVLVLVLNS